MFKSIFSFSQVSAHVTRETNSASQPSLNGGGDLPLAPPSEGRLISAPRCPLFVFGLKLISAALLIAAAKAPLVFAEAAPRVNGLDLATGQQIEVKPKSKGQVIVFMSAVCPCSNQHLPVVKKLAQDFPDYQFVVIHANADEGVEQAREYFKKADLPFPVIQDSNLKLANELKALKTPHSFLVNDEGQIVYRGGVTSSASASPTDTQFLRNALEDLKNGQAVKVANGRTLGCSISR